MRYLGIDLGDKRTGLALGDDVTRMASPLKLIEQPFDPPDGARLHARISAEALEELGSTPDDSALVLGLPLNADGTESPRSKQARAFAAKLHAETGRAVHLFDERRTSLAADARLARSGMTHKQKKLRRDAIAAAELLKAFLNQGERGIAPPDQAGPMEQSESDGGTS